MNIIISISSYEAGAKHSAQRWDRAVDNCTNIRQRVKQGSRTNSVLRQSISQFQKCMATHWNSGVKHTQRYDRAVHNCKNTTLRECLVEKQSSIRRYAAGVADSRHPELIAW